MLDLLIALTQPEAEGVWVYAFDHLFKDHAEEMSAQLEALRPVGEILATGDRTKLDSLAPEQRDFVLDVLKRFEAPEDSDDSPA